MGEGGDRLAPAVFEHLEIVGGEIGDRIALRIGDEGVDVHRVNLDAEGGRRFRPLRLLSV